MAEPVASRPYMPGYGTLPAGAGGGLLPWDWALVRLTAAHDYWLATVRPDGRPHLMPVWGVWVADMAWFSSSPGSRKTRNLAANPLATISTDNPREPVVVEGEVSRIGAAAEIEQFARVMNEKYRTDYPIDFFAVNACFRLKPRTVFGLTESNFTGSPTRWTFR
jgi:PPOX class probable F420-dependent enzyme